MRIANLVYDGDYKKAQYCLQQARQKRKIHHTTVRLRDYGRPFDLLSGFRISKPEHEYFTTEACDLFPNVEWLRGYDVQPELRPDAQAGRMFLELDMNTEKKETIREKFKNYKKHCDPAKDILLVVVHDADWPSRSEKRVENLMKWGDSVGEFAAYITLEALKKDPLKASWRDGSGSGITMGTILGKKPG